MKKTSFLMVVALFVATSYCMAAQERYALDLSGAGWYLWYDKDARWQTEAIQLNIEDARKYPVAYPTEGWDILTSEQALAVNVPGTAEEYLQTISGPEGDITGVTWWSRTVNIPEYQEGQRVVLHVGSMRSRAEIFINQRLVDYQIVDNVPFQTDITPYVIPGEQIQLAIRITDAGGNHDWRDSRPILWGSKMLPPGHGFGGITGKVYLEVHSPVYIEDIYMQNTPQITTANAILTLQNKTQATTCQDVRVTVYEWNCPQSVLFTHELKNVCLKTGINELSIPIKAPNAKLWNIDDPNLYICKVELQHHGKWTDGCSRRFGFRWFDADGIGQDAIFRLNGKRIVLRSAISWSFWPVNGIYPSDELAERQVKIAKELGLNMLNFHRFIGYPTVLDYADELGLLLFEEPGGFRLNTEQPFMNSILHEKVVRMVKRDRSHPSLIIYNLMNESGDAAPDKLALELNTMKDMQALDPSRLILRTSAWAKGDDVKDQAKIHIRPFDDNIYWNGWYDYHRAGGPAVWNEDLYKHPHNYYNNTHNKREIVFFGEEGALSSPPRLEKDKEDLERYTYKGWDGNAFLAWYDEFDRYLDDKKLRGTYPTVDDLCLAMGTVSYEHQGRKIESARINNLTDAYVINGWESELTENYSGIVDCFRYPKSYPSIIARYNRPLYIAVKPRQQIAAAEGNIIVDFYIVNEKNIHGSHRLEIMTIDPQKKKTRVGSYLVQVSGGDKYGELLVEGINVPVPASGGIFTVEAVLYDVENNHITSGYDEMLSVNLASDVLSGKGAIWEDGRALQNFLQGRTRQEVVHYTDSLEKLDWVFVARPPKKEQLTMVPMEALRTGNGEQGLNVTFYEDMDFQKEVYHETSKVVNLSVIEGATPSPFVHMLEQYGIKWTGKIIPPVNGEYTFKPQSNDRSMIELLVNGKKIYEITNRKEHVGDGKIYLEKDKPANIEIRFKHPRSNARCRLDWAVPINDMPDPQRLMERALQDGTQIYILQNVEEWSEFIAGNSEAVFKDKFYVGTNWLGGVMFNKPHEIFKELPAGEALNWPYQALVHTGVERLGLVMEGEELLVGAYHTYPMALGTAMGIVPVGKGAVLFSTLDIYGNIINNTSAGLVAKKLILNMINWKRK